jgi:(4S)-4-hydroxy-5-phosphonooxypentane-2,3-dione isomerase
MTTPGFAVAVTFQIHHQHAADFQARVIQQAQDSLAKEAGCHQFDVLVDPESPTTFFLYETYDDAAAFEVHCNTPHFADFRTTVSPWIDTKDLRKLTLIPK